MTLICMGQLLADVIAVLHEDIQLGSDTSGSVTIVSGGAAANVATWMGNQGTDVVLVSRVGDDVIGRALIADVESEGTIAAVSIDPVTATGSVVVLVSAGGERSMIPDAGASARLDGNDLDQIRTCELFYLSGYVLLHEKSRAIGLEAIRRAKQLGAKVAVDIASATPILHSGPAQVLSWLTQVDCILANEDEAQALTGASDPWEAATILAAEREVVVIKRGKDGAIAIAGRTRAEVAAESGLLVVDTVGAGDAFAAGFLPAWAEGASLHDALTAGNTLAARCIAQLGARPTPRRITA